MQTDNNFSLRFEQAKAEILADIADGTLPATIKNFGDLDEHVDANCYGGFCDDEVFDGLIAFYGGRDENEGMPEGMINLINQVQTAIDDWLKERTKK